MHACGRCAARVPRAEVPGAPMATGRPGLGTVMPAASGTGTTGGEAWVTGPRCLLLLDVIVRAAPGRGGGAEGLPHGRKVRGGGGKGRGCRVAIHHLNVPPLPPPPSPLPPPPSSLASAHPIHPAPRSMSFVALPYTSCAIPLTPEHSQAQTPGGTPGSLERVRGSWTAWCVLPAPDHTREPPSRTPPPPLCLPTLHFRSLILSTD